MFSRQTFSVIHTGTNGLTNGVNSMMETQKLVGCVRDLDKGKKINIAFSSADLTKTMVKGLEI